jgi:hypothetical protein
MTTRSLFVIAGVAVLASVTMAQSVRIATWNISNYTGGRVADIQNAVYGTFNGRSMRPDMILAQEMDNDAGAAALLSALNTAAGGFTDWAMIKATVGGNVTVNNSNNAIYYRTSKFSNVGGPILFENAADIGSNTNQAPRYTLRGDFKIIGNQNTSETLTVYDSHFKAQDSTGDGGLSRRLVSANNIRANAATLGSNPYIVGADFNIQTSSEASYQAMVGGTAGGRFFDPINRPGSWNGNNTYRFLHTQDPSGPGGMDDRFDQLLVSQNLIDGSGTDYVGNAALAYSGTTWDDPNHSYRVWGNDGTSFNTSLTTTGNAMVGSSIAQSLINVATTAGGHLPVFMDIRYTPVPEPATMVALGLGALAVVRRRRDK